MATTAMGLGVPAAAQQQPEAGQQEQPQTQPQLPDAEEIIVRGAFVPEEKRATSEISSVLDAEKLSITGDSDVASALRRITGLSLVRDKFIYVRGLGERYSSATLNGSPLPSPEPLRRVVPLDIFPTSILASSAVQKTFSPQYSGEFGGGLIDLRTKVAPDEQFFEFGFSVGGNTETTFRDGLTFDGGNTDFLGFDDGIRSIPDPLKAAIATGNRINRANFTDEELQTIGRSLANSQLWVIQEGPVPADVSIDANYGNSFDMGDGTLGLLASIGYSSKWQTKEGLQQSGLFGTDVDTGERVLEANDDFELNSTQNDIGWHGLLGLGYDEGVHSVQWTTLYVRNTTKEARSLEGRGGSDDAIIRREFTEFFERELVTTQLAGQSEFLGNLSLDWRGSYARSTRDAPNERFVQYRFNEDLGIFRYDDRQGRNLIRFSEIEDEILSAGFDLNYLASLDNGIEITFKAGYSYNDTDRSSEQRDFRFLELGGPIPDDLLASRIDFIFAPQNINPNRLVLQEVTGAAADPAYDGTLTIHAPYLGFDAQLTPVLRAAVGVRYEDGKQTVDSFNFFTANTGIESNIDEDDFLPAVTVTWEFYENMQVRGGFSQTLSRPQFRELAPSIFIDVDTDRQFGGNPFLQNSKLTNFDLRWEWYFGRDQFFTLGGFYKKLKDPIEETITDSGDNLQTSFQNVPRATLFGAEFEFEKRFEEVFEEGWLAGNDYIFRTNYTYSDSEVNVRDGDTVVRPNGTILEAFNVIRDGRALQGQSDHILNVQIGYESKDGTSDATLLLNYVSKRIRAVAPQTLPEILEREPVTLDFTYRHRFALFGTDTEFKLTAKNLLGDDYNARQQFGGAVVDVDTYDLGRSFSVGLSARF